MSNFFEYSQFERNETVVNLIKNIEIFLPCFLCSPDYIKMNKEKRNENRFTTSIIAFLNNSCKYDGFGFVAEFQQNKSFRVDIGVCLNGEFLFTIEAKLLPTPEPKKRKEYEYVYGDGGGIERFRKGNHGLDDFNNPLPENGMIAYIKENDFEHWHSKVNQWVLDAGWGGAEQLTKEYFKEIGKLTSKHQRTNGETLLLHHFWVKV